jgi:cytidylate kinase
MSTPVIAIDGPAASGKSTAARNLAAKLGIPYINTGSLYRAIAWKAARLGISTRDEAAVRAMLADTTIRYAAPAPGANPDIEIDGTFPGQELRAAEIAQGASNVATMPFVRAFTLQIQRDAAKTSLVVMEGRDIGTAVFPDAKYKFFLTASPRVRALRRLAQGGETPDNATVDSVAAEIAERDRQDMNRATAPLRQAEDAVLIDSSGMTADDVLDAMIFCIKEKEADA